MLALSMSAIFSAMGGSGAVPDLIGLIHSAVVLLVLVPLLPSIHPRMASVHQGPPSCPHRAARSARPVLRRDHALMVCAVAPGLRMVVGALYRFS